MATAQWITFVDGDDWIEKDYCEDFINRVSRQDEKQISISIPVSVSTRLVRFNVFRTLLMEPGLKLTGKENICRVNAALSTMRKMETGGG